ncbi:MAG: hypothetical protein AMXMBFR81_07960 [Chthonomonas sp.]
MRPEAESGISERFGAAVRRARVAKGISQEELADRAGLHRTYLGDVERGVRNITLVSAEKIAGALETKLSALLECADER